MSRAKTGDIAPYTISDQAGLARRIVGATGGGANPTGIKVRGQIEWAGTLNPGNDGVRTTRLDGLILAPVLALVAEAKRAAEVAEGAKPAASYQAKGWHAQLSALTASPRAAEVSDRAGLTATVKTLTAWLAEDRAPSKANQDKIAEAYDRLRNYRVDQANATAVKAFEKISDKVTDALRDRYGVEIRLRDITSLDFE
jgi:hypothetical protein